MVILKADHPAVVAAQFKVRLPEAVVVFSLKALRSPRFPRLAYWMVQAGFTDDSVNSVVVYGETLMVEVTGYFAGSPTVSLP